MKKVSYFAIGFLFLCAECTADCIARAYRASEGEPLYTVNACLGASGYIRVFVGEEYWDNIRQKPDSKDQAVEVLPYNESAKSILNGAERGFWHFRGTCNEVPVGAVVTLSTESSCSDLGPTMYGAMGDMTIIGFRRYRVSP